MLTQSSVTVNRTTRATPWLYGAVADVALGWCWLPIAWLMHSFEGSVTRTQSLMAIIFVVSFAHQPLTLGLVYGDRAQRAAHRHLYAWAPFGAAVLIVVGLNVSLTLVGLMAGLWNAEHTLMQRYGVLRIYGRKAGDQNGRIEKPMLVLWLVTALAFLGAYVDLAKMARTLGIDETNTRSVDVLGSFSTAAAMLFWVGVVGSVTLGVVWIRAEWCAAKSGSVTRAHSTAKWTYAAGTLGLVVAVMIDPIAGIAGYVAAHAIEYFALVHTSLRRRASAGDTSVVATATSTPHRRVGLYVLYFVTIGVIVSSSFSVWQGRLYGFLILFFGALHIVYDGCIWKLRRPLVAASLGIAELSPSGTSRQ